MTNISKPVWKPHKVVLNHTKWFLSMELCDSYLSKIAN